MVGFPDLFSFARPRAASYRDPAGELAEAPIGEPRFDHDLQGGPLGLLVDSPERLGDGDRAVLADLSWNLPGAATVFHAFTPDGGAERRLALYTLDAPATVNACLAQAGHHRLVGGCPGHLRNLGGFVRYRGVEWVLPAAIATTQGELVEDGAALARPLLEG